MNEKIIKVLDQETFIVDPSATSTGIVPDVVVVPAVAAENTPL